MAVRGAVQGVGFRPFLYRLATELGLNGWTSNSAQGLQVEVEGPRPALEAFLRRLPAEKPPRSFIQGMEISWLDAVGWREFEIRASDSGGQKTAFVLPDIATCPDCLHEIFDPANRRHGYPFTNCTNCGPRFTIIESLPYDRANTSMKGFQMCPLCQAEYDDPANRRFHAQPNACPACGPSLELRDRQGANVLRHDAAANPRSLLAATAAAIQAGKIIALKGLGGFHLVVDAGNDSAVQRLRALKHREEKPFALMFPSLAAVQDTCVVSELEARLLSSPEAPIVLLRHKPGGTAVAPSVAPHNPYLGVMLPYTPLHHILLAMLKGPVVATSGNLSDEPICIDETEALSRLGGIADLFLIHNRPIVRHVDDSIARVLLGRELVLRRARGYAPLPFALPRADSSSPSVLAVGAHLKNSVALSVGPQAFVSQHIGDLETEPAFEAFRRVVADLQRLFDAKPSVVAADAHPDYLSTQFARQLAPNPVHVQHHVAHALACMAENEIAPPALAVSWDGTGYGLDGTVWGGEFFRITDSTEERFARLRPFRLPGGNAAVKEPRRTAVGLLFELFGERVLEQKDLSPVAAFTTAEAAALKTMLSRGVNSPFTSSVGRLFDAVAALAGLHQQIRFEGQAAMELEFALNGTQTEDSYPLELRRDPQASPELLMLDWEPLVVAILQDLKSGAALPQISIKFHNALAESIVRVARRAGLDRVVLTGGCFQNAYLAEQAVGRLKAAGFRPYWHQRVPPNDGGVALGQVVAAFRRLRQS